MNGADSPEEMYLRGDTVDFQLATDPKADPKRADPVLGDLRLLIGNFKGKPTAVLYRKIWNEKKPKVFSSGIVKDYSVDYVAVIDAAKISVKVRDKQYVVEAAIPLSSRGDTLRWFDVARGFRRNTRRHRRPAHEVAQLLEQSAYGNR